MALGRKFPEAITRIQTLEVSISVPCKHTIFMSAYNRANLLLRSGINWSVLPWKYRFRSPAFDQCSFGQCCFTSSCNRLTDPSLLHIGWFDHRICSAALPTRLVFESEPEKQGPSHPGRQIDKIGRLQTFSSLFSTENLERLNQRKRSRWASLFALGQTKYRTKVWAGSTFRLGLA